MEDNDTIAGGALRADTWVVVGKWAKVCDQSQLFNKAYSRAIVAQAKLFRRSDGGECTRNAASL